MIRSCFDTSARTVVLYIRRFMDEFRLQRITTLVTGASGFVGSAVVRQLLDEGAPVRVLVRAGSDRRNLEGLNVGICEGDLRDPASLEAALKGCHALFHVAADYRLWTPRPRDLYSSNVEGTRNILRAAGEAGVERI